MGKVIAPLLINITDPRHAFICPVCVVPLRVIVPDMRNIPFDTFMVPDVNTIARTEVVADVKVKFPEVMVKSPKESATEPLVFPPKVTPPAPFKVNADG